MLRIFLIFLSISFSLQCFAGEALEAIKNNEKVFLYLNTSGCPACMNFNKIYPQIVAKYNGKCKFVKVNVSDNKDGVNLIVQYKVNYVPFVALINNKTHQVHEIQYKCLMNIECLDYEINKFLK